MILVWPNSTNKLTMRNILTLLIFLLFLTSPRPFNTLKTVSSINVKRRGKLLVKKMMKIVKKKVRMRTMTAKKTKTKKMMITEMKVRKLRVLKKRITVKASLVVSSLLLHHRLPAKVLYL